MLVPVQVTELVFRGRRDQCWLRGPGLLAAAVVFCVGSFTAWFAWVKRARPMVLHVPAYQPPAAAIGTGLAAIALLVLAAYGVRNIGRPQSHSGRAPAPWIIAIASLVLASPCYLLMGVVFTPGLWLRHSFRWGMAAGVLWAAMAYLLFRRWTATAGWSDLHRWAACFAAVVVCMRSASLAAVHGCGWS